MRKFILFKASLLAVLFSACDKEDNTPEPENEEELITTVKANFIPQGGNDTIVFSSTDIDGDGANPPVIVNGILEDSTTYDVTVEFLNELENPAEEITEEVREEGDEHQVFFTFENTLDATHSYDDSDSDGNPIGLDNTVETMGSSTGDMVITLRHEPNKSATGVANGNIENAGGSTDAEVTFDVVIQ